MITTAVQWAESGNAVVGLLLGVIALAGFLARPAWREAQARHRFQRQFREDWQGQPERPGVPARPGVMATLLDIRTDASALADRVRHLEREHKASRRDIAWILSHCPHCPDRGANPLEDEEG